VESRARRKEIKGEAWSMGMVHNLLIYNLQTDNGGVGIVGMQGVAMTIWRCNKYMKITVVKMG